jgi:glucosamine-6-phosphate deaminase
MTRQQEVRQLLEMSREQMIDLAGRHLLIVPDLDALHQHFAESIADEITTNNRLGRPTKLILPVGPVGQYPRLADIVNERRLSLENCWFFMMDEHCDENGTALTPDHPLSFRHKFNESFVRYLRPDLMLPVQQLVFPDHANVETLKDQIEAVGGIGTCYGGIGIHGHVAYNEPEPCVRDSNPRLVDLNDFTLTINAIRAGVGGNLEGHPRKGVTLGMRQILGSQRIRLYCRNGISLDWANTVLRLALFGKPGDDYPVTHIRDHQDYVVVTDENTARQPRLIV